MSSPLSWAHHDGKRAENLYFLPSQNNPQTRSATGAAAAPGAGARPFDADTYRGRNVIERSFNTVKQWRGLATRCDKLAIVYRGAAVLRAITIWLKHL